MECSRGSSNLGPIAGTAAAAVEVLLGLVLIVIVRSFNVSGGLDCHSALLFQL